MSNGSKVSRRFHKRFNVPIELDEVRQRFVNRVINLIELYCPNVEFRAYDYHIMSNNVERLAIANELGKKYVPNSRFSDYVGEDFYSCLRALEVLYKNQPELTRLVLKDAMSLSEVDLGISWREGIFYPSGAKLLDEAIVNEPLQWLADPEYRDVLIPFRKGLSDFLEATKNPQRLTDTVRDMYEALEKMARIVCGNKKNLKANVEQFVSKLALSTYYSKMLKDYTEYAHEFRHAVEEGKQRLPPPAQEVEAFIYTTGLFIRLAIERLAAQKPVSP